MSKATIGYPRLARLIHLRGLVEACPADKFDMWVWERGDSRCAGGLAMNDERFRKLGLIRRDGGPKFKKFDSNLRDRKGREPDRRYSDHLAQFFGLNYRQAEKLFCPTDSLDNWDLCDTRAQRLWFLGQLNRIIAREYDRRSEVAENG